MLYPLSTEVDEHCHSVSKCPFDPVTTGSVWRHTRHSCIAISFSNANFTLPWFVYKCHACCIFAKSFYASLAQSNPSSIIFNYLYLVPIALSLSVSLSLARSVASKYIFQTNLVDQINSSKKMSEVKCVFAHFVHFFYGVNSSFKQNCLFFS